MNFIITTMKIGIHIYGVFFVLKNFVTQKQDVQSPIPFHCNRFLKSLQLENLLDMLYLIFQHVKNLTSAQISDFKHYKNQSIFSFILQNK